MTDQTHDPTLRSWVDSANQPDTDFPIQNLPFGVFRRKDGETKPTIGIAIGGRILDLRHCVDLKLLEHLEPTTACALHAETLNDLMKLGSDSWISVRHAVSDLLREDNPAVRDNDDLKQQLFVAMDEVEMLLPASIGDYTDFYASIHHATNIGSMFRPDNPLLPNYRWVPIGYHGRASSVIISGTKVHRPKGQTISGEDEAPSYGPCKLLDYEMEMGVFVGPGNELGSTIDISNAPDQLFGMVIVNDWSARDIQKWEYQPLGPFNAKNFATSISPWVVTLDALKPFLVSGPFRREGDPPPLDYLQLADDLGIDMTVEVHLASEQMREQSLEPVLISRGNFREMYWTIGQMLVHHASGGCNMRPGDLLASGTVSNEEESSRGCLLERTWRGEHPIDLPDGTQRKFLQDGDEVIMKAYCQTDGAVRIGFGECRGVVLPTTP